MNFSEMHERLRQQLLRRIQRGTLNVSLLARQTGLGHSHLSNFLRYKRKLSLAAADRIMAAQHLSVADLLEGSESTRGERTGSALVPVVSHALASSAPFIRTSAAEGWVHVPQGLLRSARAAAGVHQRAWQRFVVTTVTASDALSMAPVLTKDALVLLDRHYNSPAPYQPGRPTIFAIRDGPELKLRYLDVIRGRLILRPENRLAPVDLIEVAAGRSPREFIAGRVAFVINGL